MPLLAAFLCVVTLLSPKACATSTNMVLNFGCIRDDIPPATVRFDCLFIFVEKKVGRLSALFVIDWRKFSFVYGRVSVPIWITAV